MNGYSATAVYTSFPNHQISMKKNAFLYVLILSAIPLAGWAQVTVSGSGQKVMSADDLVKTFEREPVKKKGGKGSGGFGVAAAQPEPTDIRQGFVGVGGEKKVKVKKNHHVTFENIHFLKDSTNFADVASRDQVEQIARALVRMPRRHFLIEGHTCDLGTDEHNLELSWKRANAVQAELERRGVKQIQLVAMGFGERELVEKPDPSFPPEKIEKVRARSRRVVVREVSP